MVTKVLGLEFVIPKPPAAEGNKKRLVIIEQRAILSFSPTMKHVSCTNLISCTNKG